MKKLVTSIAVLAATAVVLWGCAASTHGSSREESISGSLATPLEGTWIPASAEFNGSPFPDQVLKTMKLVLTPGTYAATVGTVSDIGTLTLHPDSEPKSMDVLGTEGPNKGKTLLAIYELTGDTLTVCYDLEGKTRPRKFRTTPNTKLLLVHYKRSAS